MDTGEISVRISVHLIVTEHVIKQAGTVRFVNLDTGEILVNTNVPKIAMGHVTVTLDIVTHAKQMNIMETLVYRLVLRTVTIKVVIKNRDIVLIVFLVHMARPASKNVVIAKLEFVIKKMELAQSVY